MSKAREACPWQAGPMTSNLSHFAINADDVDASRTFYESVFGWTFTAYGPPGFFRIQTGPEDDPGTRGALQERRQLLADLPTRGGECTFSVDDVDATRDAVLAAGGTILMERSTISKVGHLIAFEDPAGNPILAMQYDDDAD
jgi:uncharacterized protein